tara:strand:+ start:5223 stop:5807 length:585 start_codon:yes stop_codon:yes gene_type:complete
MSPIFTSNNESGLNGYWYDEFVQQFDSICKDHLTTVRAKKFAFIVYDFHSPMHEVLQNQGVFIELDRLSGKDITVFYLDGQLNRDRNNQTLLFRNLNKILHEFTGDQVRSIPFIVFFDFKNDDVTNLKCYSIRNNKKFILNDLTKALIEELGFMKDSKNKNDTRMIGALIKETPKIIYTEFIKLVLTGIYAPSN